MLWFEKQMKDLLKYAPPTHRTRTHRRTHRTGDEIMKGSLTPARPKFGRLIYTQLAFNIRTRLRNVVEKAILDKRNLPSGSSGIGGTNSPGPHRKKSTRFLSCRACRACRVCRACGAMMTDS